MSLFRRRKGELDAIFSRRAECWAGAARRHLPRSTAVLDRILHHAITLNIQGNSYRLKDKLKAGLVRPAMATE